MPIIELNLSETDIIDARVNVSFDRLTVILRNLVDESNEHHNDIEDLKNLLKSEKARGDELERLVKRDTTENSIIEMTKEIEDIKKVLGDLKDEVEQTVTDNKKIFSVFEEGIASNAEELKKEQESVEIIQKQVNGLQFPSLKEGTPLEKLVAELNEFRNKSEPRILAFDAFIECWSADTSKLIDLCEKNYEGHFITSNQTRTDYILSLPPFIECSNQYKTRDELLRGALEERFGIYETTSQRSRGPANAERGSDSAVSEGHKLNDDAMGSPLKAPGYEKDTSYESQDPQSDNARDVDGDTNAEVATLVKEAKTQQQAVRKALGILDNSVKVQEDLPRRVAALEDMIRSLGPKKSNVELFDTKADNSKSEGQDQSLDERISDAHSILPPSAANEELRWRVGELETEVARLEEKKADRDELVGLYNSIDNVHDVDQIGISNTHKLNNLKEDVDYVKVLSNQDVCQKPDSAVNDGYGEGVGVHGLPGTAEQGGNKNGRMGRSKNSDNAGGDGDTNAEVAHLVNEVKSQLQAVRKALGILDNTVKVQEDLPRRVAALEDVIRSLGPKKSNVELFDTKADNSKSEGQDQSLDERSSDAQSILDHFSRMVEYKDSGLEKLPPSMDNRDLHRRLGELDTEVGRLEERKADRDELMGLYNSIDNIHDRDQIGISNNNKLNNLKEDVCYGKVLPNLDVCQKPDSAVNDGYGEGVGVHGLRGTAENGGRKNSRKGRSINTEGRCDGYTNAEIAHLVNAVKTQQQAIRNSLRILENTVKIQEDLPRRVAALEDVIRSPGEHKIHTRPDQVVNCISCGAPSSLRGSLNRIPSGSFTSLTRGSMSSLAASGGISRSCNNSSILNESACLQLGIVENSRSNTRNNSRSRTSSLPPMYRPANNGAETEQINCTACGTPNNCGSLYTVHSSSTKPLSRGYIASGGASGGNFSTTYPNGYIFDENASSQCDGVCNYMKNSDVSRGIMEFRPKSSSTFNVDLSSTNGSCVSLPPIGGVSRKRSTSPHANTTPVRVFMGRTVATVRDCNGCSIPASIGGMHY